MPDLPSHVDVGPYRFEILCDDDAHARAVRDHGDDLWGLTQQREQRITLCPAQHEDHRRVTLLHELLHAVCHATGAELLLDEIDDDAEERLIQLLAPAVTTLMRANPDIVAYLTAD